MKLGEKRLTIVTGHYGSGKTEFSVNLACVLGRSGRPCALCDLDILNPYFRAREREGELGKHGVRLISSSLLGPENDVPALPAELFAVFQDKTRYGVIDLGGDEVGARALARFRAEIDRSETKVLFVLNANRPETGTTEQAAACLEQICSVLGLDVTGIVNNTHLCGETAPEDVLQGAVLAEEIAARTGIPVACHVVHRKLVKEMSGRLSGEVFPIQIYMRKPWEEEDNDGKSEL